MPSSPRRRGPVAARVGVLTLLAAGLLVLVAAPYAVAAITPAPNTPAGAMDVAQAMEFLPGLVTSADWHVYPTTSAPYPAGVSNATITPLYGIPNPPEFAILTSGDVRRADDASAPGSQVYGTSHNGAFDVTVLKLGIQVPANHNCLSLRFQFLSDEWPTFVGSQFNDAFIAELDAHTWSVAGGGAITAPDNFAYVDIAGIPTEVSINSIPMNASNAAGSTYGGASAVYTAMTQVTPGGTHDVYLSMFDAGDHVLDSAVFLDMLVTGQHPNPAQTCVGGAHLDVPPIADFDFDAPCHHLPVPFTDLSTWTTSPILWVQWDFGDGTVFGPAQWSPGAVHHHNYAAPGTYTVTLTVQDAANLNHSVTKDVTVCNDPPVIDAGDGTRFVIAGRVFQINVAVHDPNDDPVTVWVDPDAVPHEASWDATNRVLHWSPGMAHVGTHQVRFFAEDPWGASAMGEVNIHVVPPEGGPASLFDSTGDGIPDRLDPCPEHFTPSSDPSQCRSMDAGGGHAVPRPRSDDPGTGTPVEEDAMPDGPPDEVPPEEDLAIRDDTDSSGDGIPDRLSRCPLLFDPFQLADEECRLPGSRAPEGAGFQDDSAAADPRAAPASGARLDGGAPGAPGFPAPAAFAWGSILVLAVLSALGMVLLAASRRHR